MPSQKFFRHSPSFAGIFAPALLLMVCRGADGADTFAIHGFETIGSTWSVSDSRNVATSTISDGDNDDPSGQRVLSNELAWTTGTTTSTLILSEVRLAGWRAVSVTFNVSSTALKNKNAFHGGGDFISAYVTGNSAPFGGTATVTMKGNGELNWGYGNTGHSVSCQSVGNIAAAGTSQFTISGLDTYSTVALKLYVYGETPNTFWNIDDIALEGTHTTSADYCWAGGINQWSTTNQAWRIQGNPTAWANRNGDNAYFTAADSTATIAENTTIVARSLTFNADGCTIGAVKSSSSMLALTDGGSGTTTANTIDVTDNNTAEINAAIIKNRGVGLTKTGAGTLVLGGTNSYVGQTSILGGALSISRNRNLGADGTRVFLDGGTLRFSEAVDLSTKHSLTFGTNGGTLNTPVSGCAANVSGWTGSGAMTKTGGGMFRLDGESSGFYGTVRVGQGTLSLTSGNAIPYCSDIIVDSGAAIRLPDNFYLGSVADQTLTGSGDVIGNLQIGAHGTHEVGNSPDIQYVYGSYFMTGDLKMDIAGGLPGDGLAGYDQVVVSATGGQKYDVSLNGLLSLYWSETDWSSDDGLLWIIKNDTAGSLNGSFTNYSDGQSIGVHGGRSWIIHYGADAEHESLSDGNDVVLVAVSVPEPSTFVLFLTFLTMCWLVKLRIMGNTRISFSPPKSLNLTNKRFF